MTAANRNEAEIEVLPNNSEPRNMLSEKEVLQKIPVGRTTLYRMQKANRFPKSIYVSPNRRFWFADEILSWQNNVDAFDPKRGRGKGRRPRDSP